MKVYLLQDVPKIGKKHQVINVSNGYAQNALFPRNLAILATKEHENLREKEKEEKINSVQQLIQNVKDIMEALEGRLVIRDSTHSKNKLYKSLHERDISEAIKLRTGKNVTPEMIQMDKPIKEVGEHTVLINVGDFQKVLVVEVA